MRQITVFRDPTRYASWLATYGIWSWGNEIVFGFTLGYPSKSSGFHTRDRRRPFEQRQARSLDGGLLLSDERAYLNPYVLAVPHLPQEGALAQCSL